MTSSYIEARTDHVGIYFQIKEMSKYSCNSGGALPRLRDASVY